MSDEDDGSTGNESDDPFEQLDRDVEGREGDPFEDLSESVAESTEASDEGDDDGSEPIEETNWADEFGVPRSRPSRDEPEHTESEVEATDEQALSDSESVTATPGPGDRDAMTGMLGEVGEREGDPFDDEGLFEERDADDLDPDVVWKQLESPDSGSEQEPREERTFAEVSKHSYCEQCRYFSEPPDISCTHEGTSIVEFLDMETVRVVDCPIVAERRELDQS